MQPQTSIRLDEEPFSAVLARVAHACIRRDYRLCPLYEVCPGRAMGELARGLERRGFRALSVWVQAYAFHYAEGRSTAATRQWIVQRARWAAMNRASGKPWARVPGR